MPRSRSRSREKMSWLSTLLIAAVFMLVIYCIYIAYSSYAQTVEPRQRVSLENMDWLHPVTNPDVAQQSVEYEGFTVNFNPELHIPNWVSWELLGNETTGDHKWSKFMNDPKVKGCPQPRDYTGTGYDRGHMVPRADMKWSHESVRQCYYMTNMCPQSHALNAGAWKKLETKCRDWAEIDSAIVIICGPVLTPVPDEFIGETQVAVPKAFFKVIAAPYANPPRAIGFIMNNGYVEGGMQAAAVTVDSIEALTGHDFFASLPDSIENEIESQCRFHYWSARKIKQ